MNTIKRNTMLAAAVAGLLLSSAAMAADEGNEPTTATVKCQGVNSCKGTGACGGAGHGCAGKNACKGQGFLKTTADECKKLGGKAE